MTNFSKTFTVMDKPTDLFCKFQTCTMLFFTNIMTCRAGACSCRINNKMLGAIQAVGASPNPTEKNAIFYFKEVYDLFHKFQNMNYANFHKVY